MHRRGSYDPPLLCLCYLTIRGIPRLEEETTVMPPCVGVLSSSSLACATSGIHLLYPCRANRHSRPEARVNRACQASFAFERHPDPSRRAAVSHQPRIPRLPSQRRAHLSRCAARLPLDTLRPLGLSCLFRLSGLLRKRASDIRQFPAVRWRDFKCLATESFARTSPVAAKVRFRQRSRSRVTSSSPPCCALRP